MPPSNRNIGGSVLPANSPEILKVMKGKLGSLQVRAFPELDTHLLFYRAADLSDAYSWYPIAAHHNGFSCHVLATRIMEAWKDAKLLNKVQEQADYLLSCGGMTLQLERLLAIAGKEEA